MGSLIGKTYCQISKPTLILEPFYASESSATEVVFVFFLQIPGALHKGVSDKLVNLEQGRLPDLTGKWPNTEKWIVSVAVLLLILLPETCATPFENNIFSPFHNQLYFIWLRHLYYLEQLRDKLKCHICPCGFGSVQLSGISQIICRWVISFLICVKPSFLWCLVFFKSLKYHHRVSRSRGL